MNANNTHNANDSITATLVPEQQRMMVTAQLFGMHFPMKLEPFVFYWADGISENYQGGCWAFYTLSNGGFFMAPSTETNFKVSCDNGYEGELSATAFGIVCCLYAYSHLSFQEGNFPASCAEHYHLLREYMYEHGEVGNILRAID
jgi:hypothetical protein